MDVHWKYGKKEEKHKGFFEVEWLRQNCYSTINTSEKRCKLIEPLVAVSKILVLCFTDVILNSPEISSSC